MMAESIQSFVEKLQADGLEAGRKQAEKIIADAQIQANQIIQQAQSQAEKIIADAKEESENTRTRVMTELELAARDTVLKLQDTLVAVVRDILALGIEQKLSDPDFLGKVLYEIVLQYVKCETQGEKCLTINVPEDMREKLIQWAIEKIHNEYETLKATVDLHGRLKQAGFEYRCNVSDGTVEITVDSVIESLSEMIGPQVRKILSEAVADMKNKNTENTGNDS